MVKAAEPKLQRMVEDVASRRAKAVEKLKRAEASEVYERLKAVQEKRDELGEELKGVLGEHDHLYEEYIRAVAEYSQDDSNTLTLRLLRIRDSWIRKHFGKWLEEAGSW